MEILTKVENRMKLNEIEQKKKNEKKKIDN